MCAIRGNVLWSALLWVTGLIVFPAQADRQQETETASHRSALLSGCRHFGVVTEGEREKTKKNPQPLVIGNCNFTSFSTEACLELKSDLPTQVVLLKFCGRLYFFFTMKWSVQNVQFVSLIKLTSVDVEKRQWIRVILDNCQSNWIRCWSGVYLMTPCKRTYLKI